jgi:integrase/recombinase XerC
VLCSRMLLVYRRHREECRHRAKGRSYRHCGCPIHIEGKLRGKMVRKALSVRSWDAAQGIVRDWEIRGRDIESLSVREARKRFIADLTSRGLVEASISKSELLLDELEGKFGELPVARITTDDLAKFREGWNVRPITAIKKLERLRSFFKFCLSRKWVDENPALALRPPKEIAIEVKPYEKEELEKIGWAIPLFPIKGIYGDGSRTRIDAFVKILRWTGLRIRDVVQLKKSAVQNGSITLRTHKNKKPVKLVLHPDAVKALEEVKNLGDYFFWSGLGNAKSCVGDWQRTLRRLGEIAGVHIHAHRWRHTFATDLLSKGVPVSEVAAILGNSPRIVEKHYSQWIESRQAALEEAVKRTWL